MAARWTARTRSSSRSTAPGPARWRWAPGRAPPERIAAARGDPLPPGRRRAGADRRRCARGSRRPGSTATRRWTAQPRRDRRRPRQRGARRAPRPPRRHARAAPGAVRGRPRTTASPSTRAIRRLRRSAAHLDADGVTLAQGQARRSRSPPTTGSRTRPRHLGRGLVLVIDYGAEAAGPPRPVAPGRQPADVRPPHRRRRSVRPDRPPGPHDPRLPRRRSARAAAAAGLQAVGETTQAELLAAAGAGELVRARLDGPGRDARGRVRDPVGARPAPRSAGDGRLPRPGLRARASGRLPAGRPDPRPAPRIGHPPDSTAAPGRPTLRHGASG